MKVEHKIGAAFALALLAITLAGAGAYLNARQLLLANRWVVHTYDVLAKTSDLLRSVQGANIGAQGFFLTGDKTYLEPYADALEAVGGELEDLRRLTADNPSQQRSIKLLQADTNRLIAYLHERVEVRRKAGLEAVLPRLGADGKEILDQIRFRAATVRNAELQLLTHRGETVARNAWRTMAALFLLLLLAVFLLLVFYRVIRRDLTEHAKVGDALSDSERRFHGVLESAPAAMFITTVAGEIQLSNTRAQTLFGYSQEDLIGSQFSALLQVLPAVDAGEGKMSAGSSDSLPGGQVPSGKRKDHTLFPVEMSDRPLILAKERLVIHAIRERSER